MGKEWQLLTNRNLKQGIIRVITSTNTMSLTNLLTGMLDQHGDTMQQAALLAYLKQGEEAQPYLEGLLTAKLAANVFKTINKEDKYEAARAETTLAIAKWVKDHPRVTQTQTQEEVVRQIELFKAKIQTF